MKARILNAARVELREAVRFYNSRRPGLGAEFREEVRRVIQRIKQFPGGWPILTRDIRVCRANRFPYGVVYQVKNGSVLVIAIAHLHREPEYWIDRIE